MGDGIGIFVDGIHLLTDTNKMYRTILPGFSSNLPHVFLFSCKKVFKLCKHNHKIMKCPL